MSKIQRLEISFNNRVMDKEEYWQLCLHNAAVRLHKLGKNQIHGIVSDLISARSEIVVAAPSLQLSYTSCRNELLAYYDFCIDSGEALG